MNLDLSGKNAVIMGATRGLGRAVAETLAREGCRTAICARTASDVIPTVTQLAALGPDTWGMALDVTDQPSVQRFMNAAAERFGKLDILVLNVSAQSSEWDASYNVDIRATVGTVEAALPFLVRQRSGAIVGIASKAALMGVPSYKPYSAMKAALLSYMASLARELAPRGIRVNSVSPGEIYDDPGFWSRMQKEDPGLYEAALKANPSGRFAMPQEVANAVVFLASPAASFISGAHLIVDFAAHEHVHF